MKKYFHFMVNYYTVENENNVLNIQKLIFITHKAKSASKSFLLKMALVDGSSSHLAHVR